MMAAFVDLRDLLRRCAFRRNSLGRLIVAQVEQDDRSSNSRRGFRTVEGIDDDLGRSPIGLARI